MARTVHDVDRPLIFDARPSSAKRPYFQSLLARPDLFRRGAKPFVSTLSGKFFKLLLKDPEKADPNLTPVQITQLLALGDDSTPLAILDVTVPQPKRPRMEAPILDDLGDAAFVIGDVEPIMDAVVTDPLPATPLALEDGGGLATPPAPEVGGTVTPIGADPFADNNDNTSDVDPLPDDDRSIRIDHPSDVSVGGRSPTHVAGGARGDEFVGEDAPPVPAYPTHIMGQAVTFETHIERGTTGLRLRCDNPRHLWCNKYRSTRIDTAVCGHRAAAGYVGVWLSKRHEKSQGDHASYRPSRAEIRTWLDAH